MENSVDSLIVHNTPFAHHLYEISLRKLNQTYSLTCKEWFRCLFPFVSAVASLTLTIIFIPYGRTDTLIPYSLLFFYIELGLSTLWFFWLVIYHYHKHIMYGWLSLLAAVMDFLYLDYLFYLLYFKHKD